MTILKKGLLVSFEKNGKSQQVTSLNQAFNLPLLPEWEFYSLFKNFKDNNNKKAKDKIILSFYKLICKIASKLKGYSNFSIKEDIINAKPTDGLWDDNRNDEEQMSLTYQQIEEAMKNTTSEHYNKYLEIRETNLHKMKSIPICKFKES